MATVGRSIGERVFDFLVYIFLGLLIFTTLYPFYYVSIVSISDGMDVLQGKVTVWPSNPTLASYEIMFNDRFLLRSVLNSVLYTTLGTSISIFFTALIAYPVSKKRLPFRNFFITMVVVTMFFEGGIIPSYLLVMSLGMLNTIWAIVLPQAIYAFYLILMKTFFQGIPDSLEESALIDGANDIQIFTRIYVPLSKAIVATLTIFYAFRHWNQFFFPMIYLYDKIKFPVQVLLRNLVIVGEMLQLPEATGVSDPMIVHVTLKYAVIMVSALPIIMVYPFFQKYFVKGALIGSIKG